MRRLVPIASLLIALAAAPSASAATQASAFGGQLEIISGPEQNAVTVSDPGSGRIRVEDPAGVSAGSGCQQNGQTAASCSATGLNGNLGEGDDTFSAAAGFNFLIYISGAGGNDTLTGGDNADRFLGDAGNDVISGGAGADDLTTGEGDDTADGGADADRITGGGGNDTATGGPGADTILEADGDDQLDGGPDNDQLGGGVGADRIKGGSGDDTVTGGVGVDVVSGDDPDAPDAIGNDTIDSRDGLPETVSCGGGADTVTADKADTAGECETVRRPRGKLYRARGGGPDLRFTIGRRSIRRGMTLEAFIQTPASISARLVVPKAEARRRGLARRALPIGGATGGSDPGRYDLAIGIGGTRKVARILGKLRRLKVQLVVSASDSSGKSTARIALVLKR